MGDALDRIVAAARAGSSSGDDVLELTRRVASPEGVKRYHKPIGSPLSGTGAVASVAARTSTKKTSTGSTKSAKTGPVKTSPTHGLLMGEISSGEGSTKAGEFKGGVRATEDPEEIAADVGGSEARVRLAPGDDDLKDAIVKHGGKSYTVPTHHLNSLLADLAAGKKG